MSIPRVDPHFDDEDFAAAAQRFLDAGVEFWEACHKHGHSHSGAVQWLESQEGYVAIFTRGEYRETLMTNIDRLPNTETYFFRQEVKND